MSIITIANSSDPYQKLEKKEKLMPKTLELLKNYNRSDILEFRPNKTIHVIKWDKSKQDIDYMNSIVK